MSRADRIHGCGDLPMQTPQAQASRLLDKRETFTPSWVEGAAHIETRKVWMDWNILLHLVGGRIMPSSELEEKTRLQHDRLMGRLRSLRARRILTFDEDGWSLSRESRRRLDR